MDFKQHIETAWGLTLKNVVSLILITLVMAGVSALTLGILAPVIMAGYFQSILMMIRNQREPKVQDLFSKMNLFLPLFGFGVAVFILSMIGFMLFFLPGVVVVLAVTFCTIYMLPLMTDKNLSLMDAVKESYKMATTGQIVDHVIVVVIFIVITMIGSSVIFGFFFTQPLATIFLLSTYEEKINSVPPPPQP